MFQLAHLLVASVLVLLLCLRSTECSARQHIVNSTSERQAPKPRSVTRRCKNHEPTRRMMWSVAAVFCASMVDVSQAQATTAGSCAFESNLCGWAQRGRKRWVRGTSTPSASTGASRAQSGSYFVYLETSSPSSSGWQSSLVHPVRPGYKSVTFHYHMHGATMGTLRLDAYAGGTWETMWSKSGQQQRKQGDNFTQAQARRTPPLCATHAA